MFLALWDKLKAASFHSLTMAWSYVLMVGGTVLANVDTFAAVVTDKQVSDQIAAALGASPTILGKWIALVGVITTVARVRGLIAKKG